MDLDAALQGVPVDVVNAFTRELAREALGARTVIEAWQYRIYHRLARSLVAEDAWSLTPRVNRFWDDPDGYSSLAGEQAVLSALGRAVATASLARAFKRATPVREPSAFAFGAQRASPP